MPPLEHDGDWRPRLIAALRRYEEAKRRTGEAVIERLKLPFPDGDMAHRLALREETNALVDYKNLLATFATRLRGLPPSGQTEEP